jgi:hypothetical protein
MLEDEFSGRPWAATPRRVVATASVRWSVARRGWHVILNGVASVWKIDPFLVALTLLAFGVAFGRRRTPRVCSTTLGVTAVQVV